MPTNFCATQYQFSAHLRDPDLNPAPSDIEPRRMKIYSDLVYNNIESFVSSTFPVLHSLLNHDHWQRLVRGFVRDHISHTPYFLEIAQEFLTYLQQEYQAVAADPVFMLELAHYEWVELALDVSSADFSGEIKKEFDLLATCPQVSPLSWSLCYQYPVHRIDRDYQPFEVPEQLTFLVVYRNRAERVKFLETNQVTARLLQILAGNDDRAAVTGSEALQQIATELKVPNAATIVEHGSLLLQQLYDLDILCDCRHRA